MLKLRRVRKKKNAEREESKSISAEIVAVIEESKTKKALLFAALFGSAVLGRAALQGVPSVEPIVAFAAISSYFFGWKRGAMLGAGAFFASNFIVFGGHGPWSVAQSAGGFLAGAAPAIIGKFSKGKAGAFVSLVAAAALFELAVNIGTPWVWVFGPSALFAAVPFGIVHLASTIGFGMTLYAFKDEIRKWIEEGIRYEVRIRSFGNSNHSGGAGISADYRIMGKVLFIARGKR